MVIYYWWCVLVYTIIVGLYGVSAYIAPCPTFTTSQIVSAWKPSPASLTIKFGCTVTCSRGPRVQLTLRYSIPQMALDVLGDILSKTESLVVKIQSS